MDQMEGEGASAGARAQPLQLGHILLQNNLVLHEKRPISSCVFRGTFGNKFLGNEDIALKITEDGELKRKEAKLHHSLPEHPNLVRSFQMDAFDYRGDPSIYIAMELCEINLYEYIVKQNDQQVPFDPIKYLSFAKDIARGLSFFHALKKIHRNLKPSNILLTENCTIAKISDFGLSETTSGCMNKATQPRSNAGQYVWKSPEVLKADTYICTSTDIFSCGILFIFIWSYGKHPYRSERNSRSHFLLLNEAPYLDGILLENPTLAKHLVSLMLNRNSEQRPTADDVMGHKIFNQEDKAAKPKISNNLEEPQNLEHVEIGLEDRLFNTHLELVEQKILAKKYEEATQYQEKLVKFAEYQDSSPEVLKAMAEHYRESNNFIRSFVLLHTAAKLVKVYAAAIAEAELIKKIVNKMNEVVVGMYEVDESKGDIFKDYFILCMNEFTVEEMAKTFAPTVFLEELRRRFLEECSGLGSGYYLVLLIEKNMLDRNYDEAEKYGKSFSNF